MLCLRDQGTEEADLEEGCRDFGQSGALGGRREPLLAHVDSARAAGETSGRARQLPAACDPSQFVLCEAVC